MLDVEFYRLYNGFRARNLMPFFAVNFAIFTKVCRVLCYFCRDFLLSLFMCVRIFHFGLFLPDCFRTFMYVLY